MGGLFGGILGLINIIGGGILYALLGSPAWRPTSRGRWVRVLFGGATLGVVTYALFYYFVVRGSNNLSSDDMNFFFACFLAIFGVFVAIAVGLERLRRSLSVQEEEPDNDTYSGRYSGRRSSNEQKEEPNGTDKQ